MDATRRRLLAWACAPAAGGVASNIAVAASLTDSPRFARGVDDSPRLARGVNITHWFEYERSQVVTAAEFRALKANGLDHVRLPVDPVVFDWTLRDSTSAAATSAFQRAIEAPLRAAVADALQAGLEVVVDLHFTGDTKQAIEDDASLEQAVVRLWTLIASLLVDTPGDRVAVELLNEPQYYGLARLRWPGLQRRLLAAVRAVLPRHLVLASGSAGASVEGLAALQPLDDGRIAYVFHYYLPYLFTHQGAQWMDTRYTRAGLFHDLRYPAALQQGVQPRLGRAHPKAAADLAEYLRDDWSERVIARTMQPAFEWARIHRARVVCNEFGVIRDGVEPASRYRWLGDVRRVLEAQGIGWSVWDYKDIFGIASGAQGAAGRAIEPDALAALGLKAAA